MEILDAAKEQRERLHLIHETVYSYSKPVEFSPHRLVLRPREGHDVHLLAMNLETFPVSRIRWYRDILDNSIAVAEFDQPGTELRIRSEFVLVLPPMAREAPQPIFVPYPSQVEGIDELVAVPYRQFTYPPEIGRLRNWHQRSAGTSHAGEPRPIFDDLAKLIHRTVSYTRREESGVQSPLATLNCLSGSCRDMAVLMIETSRALGYPARFVSGYLESDNSRVGRGSTHAWAEIYLPDYGWTGYDPSIGRRIGPGHVAVGVSQHPRGVMPVTGGFINPGGVIASLQVNISTRRLLPAGTQTIVREPLEQPATGNRAAASSSIPGR